MGKTEQKKYSKEIEAIVENMSLMDDDLMARVFDENIPATQLLLRTILSRDVEVIEAKGQWDLKNPLVEGRNIRLDVFAKDVNGAYEAEDALGRLLKDMKNKDVTGFYNEELEKGVRQFKDDKEGKDIMCEAVENYAEQYAAGKYDSGKSEGKIEGKIEAIRALMKNLKLSAEQAMESIGIPKSEYNKYMSKL